MDEGGSGDWLVASDDDVAYYLYIRDNHLNFSRGANQIINIKRRCERCIACYFTVGGRLGLGSDRVGWCYACVYCESGFSVLMAGPVICILF